MFRQRMLDMMVHAEEKPLNVNNLERPVLMTCDQNVLYNYTFTRIGHLPDTNICLASFFRQF